jgi:hypothetical protein
MGGTLKMAQPDLAVDTLTPVNATVSAGGYFPLTAVIHNYGDAPTGYYDLEIYISPETHPEAPFFLYGITTGSPGSIRARRTQP